MEESVDLKSMVAELTVQCRMVVLAPCLCLELRPERNRCSSLWSKWRGKGREEREKGGDE